MKKYKENEKAGIYIFIINLILVLYTFTEGGNALINFIVMISSTLVAIGFNGYFLIVCKKRIINIISMILNVITLLIIVLLKIMNII